MSILEKYWNNVADFKDYRKGVLDSLASTATTQVTVVGAVINNNCLYIKDSQQQTNVENDTDFVIAGDMTMFVKFQSFTETGTHHIYSAYNVGTTPRYLFRRQSGSVNWTVVDSLSNTVTTSSIIQPAFEDCFLALSYNKTTNKARFFLNGAFYSEHDISGLTGNLSLITNGDIGAGVGRSANLNDNIYYAGLMKDVALTDTEIYQLYSELENIKYEKKVKSKSSSIYFMTEYGALANTKTLTAGYIENTPFYINSGSFRVVTDTYSTHTIKSIECVSGGSFNLKGYYEGSTWSLYYDSGSGYAISDGSGIVSGSTFTMSAGDKLLLADVTGDYNLNKS